MARTTKTDYLQNFRFHVKLVAGTTAATDWLATEAPDQAGASGEAGFQNCSIPELAQGTALYRDGLSEWAKKQVGIPTVGDVTLTRGVCKTDSKFYQWWMACMGGLEGSRVDLEIWHYQRGEFKKAQTAGVVKPSRVYKLFDVFPTNLKPSGDLSSDAEDVSIAEITLVSERMELWVDNVHVGAVTAQL